MVDGNVYATESHEVGDEIIPLDEPVRDGYVFSGWSDIPSVMPAYNVTITGTFLEIPIPTEDTDLTEFDNVLYIEGAEATVGSEATLSLKMNNQIPMTGFQCDVFLPEGVEFVIDDEFYMIDLSTARTTSQKTNTFDSSLQPNGSVRILCGSTKSYTFSGTEGEVATIKVSINNDVTDGEYPLVLKNIVMSDASGKTYKVDLVKTTLSISSYMLGDPNNDGEVNIGDYTTIANHILGNDGDVFIEKAADVNCDTEINVGDLTAVANLILYGSTAGQSAKSVANRSTTNPVEYDNIIYLLPESLKPGETKELSVKMKNAIPMTGFQFDIVMPDGIAIDMDDDFYNIVLSTERTTSRKTNTFDSALQPDGSVRVLCGSTKSYTFDGNDGEVAIITVVAAENANPGNYTMAFNDIVMSDATGRTYKVENSEVELTVEDTTGIVNIIDFSNMNDGKYIQNNRLIIKKDNRLYNAHGEIIY